MLKNLEEPSVKIPVLILLFISLVFVYSSTVIHSISLFGKPHTFFYMHLGWIIAGLICFIIATKFSYQKVLPYSRVLMWINIGLLIVLAIAGLLPCDHSLEIAKCINGANRWIYFNPAPFPKIPLIGVLSVQPAELAKLVLVLYLAMVLGQPNAKKTKFVSYISITGILVFLIMLQPNMSTAISIFAIATVIYFVSGAELKPFLYLIPIVFMISTIFVLASPYRRERLLTFFSQNAKAGQQSTDSGSGYQVRQVNIALGSGGFFGVGFGNSRQKYQYLPEVATDSMYAIIGEELGFLGITILNLLYLFLFFQGYLITKNARDNSAKMVAAGITAWVGVQFFTHVFANVGIIPYTGVPLPLISYGGSSMVFLLAGLGVLESISS